MSHSAELWSSSIDLVSEDQRDAVESILNGVRKLCLEVAPLNEVQGVIDHARIRLGDIFDTVPSDIEEALNLCGGLIVTIYAQRESILRSVENGFPLHSPNFIESHIRLLIAPKFELSDEEIEMLEKSLRENISGRASGKRRKAKKLCTR